MPSPEKKPGLLIFFIILALCGIILGLRFFGPSRQLINDFFSSFQKPATAIDGDPEIPRDHEDRLQHVEQQYTSLLLNVNLKPPPGYKKVFANITIKDPLQGGRRFRINRGSEAGITVGQAVIQGRYLIGRIHEVSKNSAQVITLIVRNAHGILRGVAEEAWTQKPYCMLIRMPRDITYPEGATVLSSIHSEQMPSGLLIGVTAKPRTGSMVKTVDQLYKNIWVQPQAFQTEVSVVSVLIPAMPDMPGE